MPRSFKHFHWAMAGALGCTSLSGQDIRVAAHAALQVEGRATLTALAFSGDGRFLAAGDGDGGVQCFRVDAKVPVARFPLKGAVQFLGFLSGETGIVAVTATGTITCLDVLKGPGTTFQTGRPLRAALDAGRQYLAVATREGRIHLFDLKAGLPLGQIDARGRLDDLLFLGFDRLAQQLVAIDRNARVSSWNPATLKLLREMPLSGGDLHGSQSVVQAAATNRAANVFVVGLEETALAQGRIAGMGGGAMGGGLGGLVRAYTVRAYDWATGTELKKIKTPAGFHQMALGPGNDHVATSAEDEKGITLVDLRKGEMAASVTTADKPTALAVSPEDGWLAAGGRKGALTVWKLQFREEASVARMPQPSLAGRVRATTGTAPALPAGTPVRVAILNFQGKGVPQETAELCLDSLSNSLANVPYLTLVERRQVEAILAEQKLQGSALTDEATSVQIGKLLNAGKVITCSIGRLGTTLVLTARVLDVETAKVLAGREVLCEECRDQDIFDAVKMLASTLAQ